MFSFSHCLLSQPWKGPHQSNRVFPNNSSVFGYCTISQLSGEEKDWKNKAGTDCERLESKRNWGYFHFGFQRLILCGHPLTLSKPCPLRTERHIFFLLESSLYDPLELIHLKLSHLRDNKLACLVSNTETFSRVCGCWTWRGLMSCLSLMFGWNLNGNNHICPKLSMVGSNSTPKRYLCKSLVAKSPHCIQTTSCVLAEEFEIWCTHLLNRKNSELWSNSCWKLATLDQYVSFTYKLSKLLLRLSSDFKMSQNRVEAMKITSYEKLFAARGRRQAAKSDFSK